MSRRSEFRREHPVREIVLPDQDLMTNHQPLRQPPELAERPVCEIVLPVWDDGSMPTRRDQE